MGDGRDPADNLQELFNNLPRKVNVGRPLIRLLVHRSARVN